LSVMRDFSPAPFSTIISNPRAANFFTVSAEAATRLSDESDSLAINSVWAKLISLLSRPEHYKAAFRPHTSSTNNTNSKNQPSLDQLLNDKQLIGSPELERSNSIFFVNKTSLTLIESAKSLI